MAVYRVLDISTAHMSLEMNNFLTSAPDNSLITPVRVSPHQHGFILFIGTDDKEDKIEDIRNSPMAELLPVIEYAWSKNCYLINFDADGDDVDDLATYVW